MLDQRGKLIREISKKSGAHTHFLTSHNNGNRVCIFTGDMSCVLRAQRLVLQVIAGDAISSKQTRKRKRSHRDEEKVEEHDEVMEEDMKDEEPYHKGEVKEETCYGDEDKNAPGCPVRRRNGRRQLNRRFQHDYEENEEDMYTYDDSTEYEEHPCQPIRRQPVVARSPDTMRMKALSMIIILTSLETNRRRRGYDEYGYEHDSDGLYESSIVGEQVIKRRPIGSRADEQRRPIACLGRKVQIMVPNSRLQEERSRMSPTNRRCTDGTDSTRPSSRNGSANMRHSIPRGINRGGRPTPEPHENGNQRCQK
ncbi:unnamed protein product [Peronospora destructor]|nr:unnamed protein product [Peronospora destructor]